MPQTERIKVGDSQNFRKDFQVARLVRPLRMLRGIVRAEKADGSPIAGAMVVAEPIGDRIPPTHGTADDEGRFSLPRPFGAALVYARDPAGNLAGYTTIGADDDGELSDCRTSVGCCTRAGRRCGGKPRRKRARRLWELWG